MTKVPDPQTFDLLTDVPQSLANEQFMHLLSRPGVRIERIVSTGHITPEGEWYDQKDDEWVVVIQGAARLAFDGAPGEVHLEAGQGVLIPARVRHRVVWTSDTQPTVWLAVHISA